MCFNDQLFITATVNSQLDIHKRLAIRMHLWEWCLANAYTIIKHTFELHFART